MANSKNITNNTKNKNRFSVQLKGRYWFVTVQIANMEKAGLTPNLYKDPKYVSEFFKQAWEDSAHERKAVVSTCISNDGLYHLHALAYTHNPTTLLKVSKILFQSHVEPLLGGKKSVKDYILKNPPYDLKGETVLYTTDQEVFDNIDIEQGHRSDLDQIAELINKGLTPTEIYETSFKFRRFDKLIKKAFIDNKIKKFPLLKEMENYFHFGSSGTGKTYTYFSLCEKYTPENVYFVSDYQNANGSGGSFDMYMDFPADVLFLDEYRGAFSFSTLLHILDKYSRIQMHSRYQNIIAFWTKVHICTIYSLEEIYNLSVSEDKRNTDSFEQLKRRINYIVYHYKDEEENYKQFMLPSSQYVNALTMKMCANEYEISQGHYIPEVEGRVAPDRLLQKDSNVDDGFHFTSVKEPVREKKKHQTPAAYADTPVHKTITKKTKKEINIEKKRKLLFLMGGGGADDKW